MTYSSVTRTQRSSADVKGMDRFRYFHRPVFYRAGKSGLNIDKKTTRLELPQLKLGISKDPYRSFNNLNVPSTDDYDLEVSNANFSASNSLSVNIYQNVVFGSRVHPLTLSTSFPQLQDAERNSNVSRKRGKNSTNSAKHLSIGTKNCENFPIDPKRFAECYGHSGNTCTYANATANQKVIIGKSLNLLPSTMVNSFSRTTTKPLPSLSRNQSQRLPRPCHAKVVQSTLKKAHFPETKVFLTEGSSKARLLGVQDKSVRSFATQTDKSLEYHAGVKVKVGLECKATQTPSLSDPGSRSLSESDVELERRNELLNVVEQALDETIDRRSRFRANQFIVSSARKQFEVWKDAKEFVTRILLPRSIQEANSTRRRRSKRHTSLRK